MGGEGKNVIELELTKINNILNLKKVKLIKRIDKHLPFIIINVPFQLNEID